NRESIDCQRRDGMIFGPVDIIPRRAIDDRLRPCPIDRLGDRPVVRHVKVRAGKRQNIMRLAALINDRRAQLSLRPNNRNPQTRSVGCRLADRAHAAFSTANSRMRLSSNTPSHRATTAVAMQLPMTFTAVRPMSIT